MANKKDFSNVNKQPLYSKRDEATAEPLPGQLAFTGNDGDIAPLDATEQPAPDIEQTIDSLEMQRAAYSAQLAHAELGESAPPELVEEQAELRRAMGLPPKSYARRTEPKRKNNKRAGTGMQHIYTYLTPDNLDFLDTMAGLHGITRQAMLNDILNEERKKSAIYKDAQKLKEKLQKGQ